jgi:TonB-linked SusC/RagA family outer membrane protein
MKNKIDLWVHSNPALQKLIKVLNLTVFIILISFSNVFALSSNSDVFSDTSEDELQQAGVTGTVTDATTGEVMPGVNILIKGTTLGTTTGIDGKYSFASVDRNATLVFSFIGYVAQEIPAAGKSIINVSLAAELTGLEEVVVTGYATVRKQSLTGAISSIKTADIISTKTTSVASMVQGKVPGLMIRKRTGEPGVFNSYVSIRGFGTPLLVIDGVIRDNMSDFERLNPQDIESLSVLKDASAAIYGMNSDNGVLIVTTKSGTKGKTKINYYSTYTWKQPTTQGFQNTTDAYTFRVMKNEMSRNYRLTEPFSAAELAKWQAGTEPGYTDYNWYTGVLNDGVGAWNHNISITGGNDVITHYTSFGFMNDFSILTDNRTDRYKKFNFRTAFDANLAKGLTFKMKFAGKMDERYNPPQTFYWMFKQMLVSDRGTGPYTLANPKHYSVVPSENVNLFAKMSKEADGYQKNVNYQYQISGELNYDLPFLKGLSVNVLGAFDGNLLQYTQFRGSFILYDYRTDAPGSPTQANLTESMTNFLRTVVQGKITYKTTIAQSHNISALVVSELRQITQKDVGGFRQYDEIFTHDILNQASITNQTTNGGFSPQAYLSYLGRFNYDYKGKYLAEFSFREDGSYRYAPDKRWAFFPSGSVGWRLSEEGFIKYNLQFISDLKIRASYGQMGADAGNPWQYYPGYRFYTPTNPANGNTLSSIAGGAILSPGKLTLGMMPPGVINENLTWVETKTTDIGVDISLWKGKLGIVADIFQKTRNGLLATRATAVPNTFGATFPQENLNSDQVKGYDAEISHKGTIGNVNYGISANVTYSRTYKLKTELPPYQSTWNIWQDANNGDGRLQGRGWVYKRDGIYTDLTQYETAPLLGGTLGNSYGLPGTQVVVDVNGDGRITGDDQLPERWDYNLNPPLQFGMNIYASWKGIDFNMLMQGASMFTCYFNSGDTWGYKTYPSMWDFWLDRWQQADPSVSPFDPAAVWIPGKYAPLQGNWTGTTQGTGTDLWNIPATYLRIKNFEVGYTLPNDITKKAFLQDVRLSVGIVNLATFCKKELKKFDPEKEVGDYNAGLTYPLMREFNFTLSVNF